MNNISTSIDNVLLPTMAAVQDDQVTLRRFLARAIKTGTYVLFPCMFGLFAIADTFVHVLLTDKWAPSIIYIRVFCCIYMFYPLFYPNLNLLRALGKSKMYLYLEVLRKTIGVISILITYRISPLAMAIGSLCISFAALFINLLPSGRFIGYGIIHQIKDIMPNFMLSLVMALVVYGVRFLPINMTIILCLQIIVGTIIYIGGSLITKNESYLYIIELVKAYSPKIKGA